MDFESDPLFNYLLGGDTLPPPPDQPPLLDSEFELLLSLLDEQGVDQPVVEPILMDPGIELVLPDLYPPVLSLLSVFPHISPVLEEMMTPQHRSPSIGAADCPLMVHQILRIVDLMMGIQQTVIGGRSNAPLIRLSVREAWRSRRTRTRRVLPGIPHLPDPNTQLEFPLFVAIIAIRDLSPFILQRWDTIEIQHRTMMDLAVFTACTAFTSLPHSQYRDIQPEIRSANRLSLTALELTLQTLGITDPVTTLPLIL